MSEVENQIHDVIIVGSGPAGYTAAIYTARADLKPLVFAGSVTAGGELMNTTEVENFPGFPEGIQGPELMMNMQAQAERFGAQVQYEDVAELELTGDIKTVTLIGGLQYKAKSVILATGSAYRTLGVPGEQELTGHGVSSCATCDGFFFRDQDVVVVGGGDTAMEEAMFLTKFANKVYVVHRREELRASKIMAERAMANEKIEFLWNTAVKEIHQENDKVSGVTLSSTVGEADRKLDVTGVFVAIGFDPRTELFKDVVDLTADGNVAVLGRTSKTNIPGVFAAGDVLDPTYRQAISAAGSGCVAAIDVEHYLAEH
ncbi:thioredoxin-disulfide reductase [Micrococcoides hystricis]|uniref:Thioredoxin reductase n=1 Tax=Micrococcoides hystricis TaxID=1572761 RepID=A0ABV6PDM9_9MICC